MESFVRMGGQIRSDIRVWHDLSNGCSEQRSDEDAAKSVAFLRSIFEEKA